MPRVHHVKSARKAKPEYGIEVGDEYWWAKFRVNGTGSVKRCWKRHPRPSQLTLSEFKSAFLAIQERISDATDLSEVEDFQTELEELISTEEEKLGNLPDSLQSSPTADLIQERIDEVQELIDAIGCLDTLDDLKGCV